MSPSAEKSQPRWLSVSSAICMVVVFASAGCSRKPESVRHELDDPARHRLSIVVEDSGSAEVDTLVKRLVSARPAPYPDGYWPVPIEFSMMYATPEVKEAFAQLKCKGPSIFPNLIHQLHDDRYCYSATVQAVDNHTVGQAVLDILCDDEVWGPVYLMARNSPTGQHSFLTFGEYLRAKGPEQWADWAKNKSRLEIQLDFVDWCVATEEKRGFVDANQQAELLCKYEDFRSRMKTKYSRAGAAEPERDATRSGTNTRRL